MIDPVINTLSTSTVSQSDTSSKSSELSNTFYKLLTTQIQYQDPLNPMENTEFTSQLAQLTSVEQLEGVNKNLTYLQLYMASINNSQAISFIGKEVNASGNTLAADGVNSTKATYVLGANADRVIINIYDENNNLVRTLHEGERNIGENEAVWDGRDNNGDTVAAGIYSFEVLATDSNGSAINATTMLSGLVEGITFEDGVTYVTVNGQKVAIGDIITIKSDSSASETADADATDGQQGMLQGLNDTIKSLGKSAAFAAPFVL